MQIKLQNIKFVCRYSVGGVQNTTVVYPLLTSGKITKTREDYHVMTNFNGDLTFVNCAAENISDFDLLKTIEQNDISTKISIDIYVDNMLKYQGYFYPFSCSWDNDRCTCIVKLITDDKYACLNKYSDTQENIIEGVVPFGPYHIVNEPTMATFDCTQTLSAVILYADYITQGIITYITYSPNGGSSIPNSMGNGLPYTPTYPLYNPNNHYVQWYNPRTYIADHCLANKYQLSANAIQVLRVSESEYTFLNYAGTLANINGVDYPIVQIQLKSTFIAEKIITVDVNGLPVIPPGFGWVQWKPFSLGNIAAHIWLREPYYNNQDYLYHILVNQNTYQKYTLINPYENNANYDFTVWSGRKVTDIIQYFLNQSGCGLTLQSDFLTNWVNPVTGLLGKMNYLAISPCKDIKAAGVTTDLQLILKMSLKDLMDELKTRLNLFWYIDTNTNKFVVEHKMYFDKGYTYGNSTQVTKDITGIINSFTGKQEIIKTNKYTYAVDKIYNRERFVDSVFANADFFDRVIKYNIESDQNEKEYRGNFITDLAGIIEYPSRFGDEQAVLLSLQYNATLNMHEPINEPGYRTGDMVLNGHLCLSNMIPKYWNYGRMFLTGNVDGDQTTFLSVIKKILQTLSVKDCDDDIDFENLVKTNLATGEIVAMNWDIITRVKELTINV